MTLAPSNTQSSYLPPEFDVPGDEAGIRDFVNKRERLTASIINVKENAQYEKRELITGQQYFNPNVSQASSTAGTRQPQYTFRVTFDLVNLNGGNIPNGVTTSIPLPTNPATNTPIVINYVNGLIPVHGFGAGTVGTTYYFVNDPLLFVRFVNTSTTVQSVDVTNNTGGAVTQLYWVFEYIKG